MSGIQSTTGLTASSFTRRREDARKARRGARARSTSIVMNKTFREALVAGSLSATAVAVMFFLGDAVVGRPFLTPSILGLRVEQLLGLTSFTQSELAAVLGYTVLHYTAFILFALGMVFVVRLARAHAAVLAGALLLLVAAEVGFYATVATLAQTTLFGVLTGRELVFGNLLGLAVLLARLWHTHPELRRELDEAMLG